MDISIGIRNVARELTLDVDGDAASVADAVAAAQRDNQPLQLTDVKGRTVIVPIEALGYVLTGDTEARKVGFGR